MHDAGGVNAARLVWNSILTLPQLGI